MKRQDLRITGLKSTEWIKVLACLAITLAAKATSAQLLMDPVRRWTVEDGLPSNNISEIFQDSRDYLWVGTTNGLCRFNGREFDLFVDDPGVNNRLKGDFVRSVAEGPDGLIYVLNHGGGLTRYNYLEAEKGFEEVIPGLSFPKLKGLDGTTLILNVNPQSIFILYDDTIRQFDIATNKLTLFDPFRHHPEYGGFKFTYFRPIRLTGNKVAAFHRKYGAIVFNIETGEIVFQSPDEVQREIAGLKGKIRFNVMDPYLLLFEQYGKYWLYDWTQNRLVHEGRVDIPPKSKILTAGPASNATFTYTFDREVIYSYDPRFQKSRELRNLRLIDNSISIGVRGNIQTSDGSTWVATDQGLLLWDTHNCKFDNYEIRIDQHPYSSNPVITSFAETKKYPLVVGTRNTIHLYSVENEAFSIPAIHLKGKASGSPGFLFGDGEQLFIAGNGLYAIDLDHPKAEPILLKGSADVIASFQKSAVRAVLADTSSSGIRWWLSTASGGLFRWHTLQNTLEQIPLPSREDENNLDITSLSIDPYNRIVAGCSNTGLYFISKETLRVEMKVPIGGDQPPALPEGKIMSIIRTPENQLWLVQQSVGLVKIDFARDQKPVFTVIGKEKGLNNSILYSAQSDRNGNIWISSQSGIEKWDATYRQFFHYGPEHGIVENQFREPSWKDKEGKLYFASTYKFIAFHPDSLKLNSDPPKVVVKAIQVNALSRSDLLQKNHIALRADEKNVVIRFDAIEFENPKKVLFRYKINEKGKPSPPWTTTHSLEISLPNLSPGSYEIRYNAANEHGFWNTTDAVLAIDLPAPWYASLWFVALCVAGITGFFYGLYRYRLHQVKRIQEMRNRISRDLHDDIGSTLGSISIYSEVAKNSPGESRMDVLDKIGDTSREMLEKLNDIVWSINPENDTLERMEKRMRGYAAMLLNPMGIRFEMTFTPEQHSRALNMDKRRNLFLIFKEALHNAAKYAECRQINIVLAEQNGLLHMEIRDDGKGFDPLSARGYNGNGLDSMKERAKAMGANLIIESKPGSGTRIHLWQK